jgi:hypothetical protein
MKKPEKKDPQKFPFNLWMTHINVQLERDKRKLGMLPKFNSGAR